MDQENESTLGEYLKKSREEANFSIEKLSLKTRINANILKSLEAEDFKNLPSPAYLKGFVLSYVKMFSLNDTEAIKKLEQSYLARTNQKFPSLNHAPTASKKSSQKTKNTDTDELFNKSETILDTTKQFMPFIIGIIVIVASFAGYKIVSTMINQEAQTRKSIEATQDHYDGPEDDQAVVMEGPEAPQQNVEEDSPTIDEKIIETPPPTVPSVVKEASQPTPKKDEVVKKKTSKSEQGKKRDFPSIDFKPLSKNLYSLMPNAPENKDDSLMPRSYKAKLNPELQNVYINALGGETWVSYKVDEEPIQNEFIREGKALFLQGKEIRMFFGNVNVTKFFLNNTFIDAPSKTGVKSIVFPESLAPKFQRPLFPRSASGELFTAEEYIQKMNEEEQKIGSP